MPRDSKLIERRDKEVRRLYKKMYRVKETKQKDILKKLSEKFYLTEITIFRIIFPPKESKSKRS